MKHIFESALVVLMLLVGIGCKSQSSTEPKTVNIDDVNLIEVGDGYSSTSVNCAIFRNSPIVTYDSVQVIAYYDPEGYLTLGKRNLGSEEWEIHRTQYQGNVADAHNVISIGIDGDGYIHASFDHHGNKLRYCRSLEPLGLEMGELMPMVGTLEEDVTYPEFYPLAGGDLLFAYRSGASGRGNLVMNRYDHTTGQWSRVQDCLVDGEGERNAYWQLCTDADGVIHLSWVWRETWMVETNHDMCYARSRDGGVTWEKSDGSEQSLPINAQNAEYAWRIPQNSELINQTSITTDLNGNPYIATYWRDADSEVPQFRLLSFDGQKWNVSQVGERTEPFSLAGGGTKMIPISRPRVVTDGEQAYYIFRDQERGSKVTVAYTEDIASPEWTLVDVTDFPVDAWEPSLDPVRWQNDRVLDLYVQQVFQGDGEKTVESAPTKVYVLELPLPGKGQKK